MQVGDLVKYRRNMFNLSSLVGIVVKNTGMDSVPVAWWLVQWSDGKSEIISDRNLVVINESR